MLLLLFSADSLGDILLFLLVYDFYLIRSYFLNLPEYVHEPLATVVIEVAVGLLIALFEVAAVGLLFCLCICFGKLKRVLC